MSSLLVLVTLLAVAPGASAPHPQAERLVRDGIALRRSGNDEAALAKFQEAHGLAPSPRTLVQLGLCEQALGLWAEADLHLSEALKSPTDEWIAKHRQTINDSLRLVKTHVGRVEVIGSPEGAEVLVNGKPAGAIPLPGPVRVSEGPVSIELRAPGHASATRNETIAGNQYLRIPLRLEPNRSAPPAPSTAGLPRPEGASSAAPAGSSDVGTLHAAAPVEGGAAAPRWRAAAPWIAWGGAAAALGVGVGGSLLMKSKADAALGPCGEAASDGGARCDELGDGYKTGRALALGGYVGAGVLAATGLALLLTEPRHPDATEPRLSFAPLLAPAQLGGAAALRF